MGLSRRQLAVYVVLALFVTAIGVRYLVAGGEPAADAGLALSELSAGATSPPASASPSPAVASPLVVYVCGAVRSPGVYTFAPGARVADLIDRAGGAIGAAELETINLAAVLTDGQQVVVPRRGETAAATAAADPASGATGPAVGAAAGRRPPRRSSTTARPAAASRASMTSRTSPASATCASPSSRIW
jgi:competence protein ComEA